MLNNFKNPGFVSLIFLILTALAPGNAKAQNDSCRFRVSLLTASPGAELYSTFGHSALRVIDSVSGRDLVFNYGTFNFDESNFYMKFIRGKLKYFLSVDDYNSFASDYSADNRSLTEQVLNLTCGQADKVAEFLDWNMLPVNRFYKYDFTFDNCTTRLRDLVDTISGNAVKYRTILPKPISFRNAIHDYLNRNNKSWDKLGIDILLGRKLDRLMTNREVSFLPDYLMMAFDSASIQNQPLVKDKQVILKRHFVVQQGDNINNPLFIFSCLFVIIAFLSFSNKNSIRKMLASLDGIFFFAYGLLGLILIFMWIGTDHFMTKDNYNLLWAWPTNIIAAFYINSRKSFARYYFLVFAIAELILLGLWFSLPQKLNPALIPLNAIMILRSFINFRKNKKDNG
ncbi:MAG: DUF4105 domain-containing protein [Chitinophagaceae bacterium]|nr:DUF4105 domain-containing protein [Chitinophagaceae bacterium]